MSPSQTKSESDLCLARHTRAHISRFKRTPLTSEYSLMPCGTRLSFVHAGYDINGISAAKSFAPNLAMSVARR